MIRSIALGLLVAVATAGLGVLSAPAWAQEPTVEPAKSAKRPEVRLWWNDPVVVGKVGLSSDQRAQMDQLFETYQEERKKAGKSSNARQPFLEALEKGDMDQARSKLHSWAERERAGIREGGEFKIGVLSLLSGEQRQALTSAYPRLIRKNWGPRVSWAPAARRPAGTKHPEKPAD